MRIKFNLRDPKSATETPINLVVRFNGYQIVHPTGERIEPKFWQKTKGKGGDYQRAKTNFRHHIPLNARLDDIQSIAKKVHSRLIDENNRIPTPKEYKLALSIALGQTKQDDGKAISLFEFIESHIVHSASRTNKATGKILSPNTIKPYKTVQKHLAEFSKTYKRAIDWDTLDQDFYRSFTSYLRAIKKMKTNSIGKQFQNINAFVRQAEEQGIIKAGLVRSFHVTREQVDNICLSSEELAEMEALDLANNPRLERVRDLFIVGCYTGSRYSDLHKYTSESIVTNDGVDFFGITQQKTQQKVSIPVHPTVKKIINKYDGALPKVPSDQKMNMYLKEIGALIPTLQKPIKKNVIKGNDSQEITLPKYKLVTTHTARRTFASLQVQDGVPIYLVMAVTGHKTEKDFWKYIKLNNQDKGMELYKYWLRKA